jgi:hypothetical protein
MNAEIREHCPHCVDGWAQVPAPGSRVLTSVPCSHCNGTTRRVRPFSSPESAVALDEDGTSIAFEPAIAQCDVAFDRDPCVLPLGHEQHRTKTGWTWFANRPTEANEALNRLEAQCAAMREALDQWGHDEACAHLFHRCLGRASEPTPACDCNIADALSTDAGKALLERLVKAEADAKVDGPVFNHGRWEGRSDVAAQLRAVLDPSDAGHLSLDGLLAMVNALRERLASAERSLADAVRVGEEAADSAHAANAGVLAGAKVSADALGALRERLATAERERDAARSLAGPENLTSSGWLPPWDHGVLRLLVESLTKERDEARRSAEPHALHNLHLRDELSSAEELLQHWLRGDEPASATRAFLAAKGGA